jgi:hypothetical protein
MDALAAPKVRPVCDQRRWIHARRGLLPSPVAKATGFGFGSAGTSRSAEVVPRHRVHSVGFDEDRPTARVAVIVAVVCKKRADLGIRSHPWGTRIFCACRPGAPARPLASRENLRTSLGKRSHGSSRGAKLRRFCERHVLSVRVPDRLGEVAGQTLRGATSAELRRCARGALPS